jgi:hypothetical protein
MGWLRRLFGDHPRDEDDLLKQRIDQTAANSEEVMRENRNTLNALRQIREVENIAREQK